MALRQILTEGDPTLNAVCRPVTNFDDRLHELLDDMRETLKKANGLGLAAPQVGIRRRAVLVTDKNE
ncbi:MAG: peptide deformylase, partial [Oscillospiraceae bacterium]